MSRQRTVLAAALSLLPFGQPLLLGSSTALATGAVLLSTQAADAQSAQGFIKRGYAKFNKGDYKGAITDLDKAISINPESYIAYTLSGAIKSQLKDYDAAILDYTKAIGINPNDSDIYYFRGQAKIENSELSNQISTPLSDSKNPLIRIRKSAINDYSIAIRLEPEEAKYYDKRAFAKFLIGDYQGALNDFNQALLFDSNDYTLYRRIGITKNVSGDNEGACKDFKKAIDGGDDLAIQLYNENCQDKTSDSGNQEFNDRALSMIAWAKGVENEKTGKDQEAIRDFTRAIELDPGNKYAFNSRALTKGKLGDYEGAIEDYTKGLEIDPEDPLMYRNRGVDKAILEDYTGAISDYNKVIEITPDDSYAYYLRAGLKSDLGDYQGATSDYNKAIELDPQYADYYTNRGISKENNGDLKGACADWEKAAELGDKDAAEWVREQCQ